MIYILIFLFFQQICVKDRVMLAGCFELDAITTLINEKCDRLVVVFSESFFNSEEHKFFLKFAQMMGIQQRKRKIIPCAQKSFKMPPALALYFPLFYKPETQYFNFWDRLRDSICYQGDFAASGPPR